MSTAARIQLGLGFAAAMAAYLLLVSHNGGRIELNGLFGERLKAPAAEAPAAQGSAESQAQKQVQSQ